MSIFFKVLRVLLSYKRAIKSFFIYVLVYNSNPVLVMFRCILKVLKMNIFLYKRIAADIHLLVEDEVRGEVEHLGVGVFVGSPAEREGGETHPGILDQRDLVLNGQTAET